MIQKYQLFNFMAQLQLIKSFDHFKSKRILTIAGKVRVDRVELKIANDCDVGSNSFGLSIHSNPLKFIEIESIHHASIKCHQEGDVFYSSASVRIEGQDLKEVNMKSKKPLNPEYLLNNKHLWSLCQITGESKLTNWSWECSQHFGRFSDDRGTMYFDMNSFAPNYFILKCESKKDTLLKSKNFIIGNSAKIIEDLQGNIEQITELFEEVFQQSYQNNFKIAF